MNTQTPDTAVASIVPATTVSAYTVTASLRAKDAMDCFDTWREQGQHTLELHIEEDGDVFLIEASRGETSFDVWHGRTIVVPLYYGIDPAKVVADLDDAESALSKLIVEVLDASEVEWDGSNQVRRAVEGREEDYQDAQDSLSTFFEGGDSYSSGITHADGDWVAASDIEGLTFFTTDDEIDAIAEKFCEAALAEDKTYVERDIAERTIKDMRDEMIDDADIESIGGNHPYRLDIECEANGIKLHDVVDFAIGAGSVAVEFCGAGDDDRTFHMACEPSEPDAQTLLMKQMASDPAATLRSILTDWLASDVGEEAMKRD